MGQCEGEVFGNYVSSCILGSIFEFNVIVNKCVIFLVVVIVVVVVYIIVVLFIISLIVIVKLGQI